MNKLYQVSHKFRKWREKNLMYSIHPYKLVGLKIAAIGLIVGVTGALISAYLMPALGKFIFILGVLIVLVGFAFTAIVYLTPEDDLPSKTNNKDK